MSIGGQFGLTGWGGKGGGDSKGVQKNWARPCMTVNADRDQQNTEENESSRVEKDREGGRDEQKKGENIPA